jgi:hypothetical protein
MSPAARRRAVAIDIPSATPLALSAGSPSLAREPAERPFLLGSHISVALLGEIRMYVKRPLLSVAR